LNSAGRDRWSVRNIFKQYGAVVAAQGISLPLSLIWLGSIARVLGAGPFGSYLIGVATVQFLFRVAIGWASDTVIRFGVAGVEENRPLREAVSVRMCLLTVCCGIAMIGIEAARPWLEVWSGLSSNAIHALTALLPAIAWWDLGLSISRATGAIPRYATANVIRQAGLAAGAGWLLLGGLPPTPTTVLLIETATYLGMGSWLILRAGAGRMLWLRPDRSGLLRAARYAWSNGITFLAGYWVDWVDLYVVRLVLGTTAVGIYQFGYRLMLMASTGLMGLIIILFPMFMEWKNRGEAGRIRNFIEITAPKIAFFWGSAMAFLIAVTPEGVRWLGGPDYAGAAAPLALLWAGLSFQPLAVLVTPLFSVFDALPMVMGLNLAMAGLNTVGDWIGIRWGGLPGVALSTSLCYTGIGILYGRISARRFGIRLRAAWLCAPMGWLTWGLCFWISGWPGRLAAAGAVVIATAFWMNRLKWWSGRSAE